MMALLKSSSSKNHCKFAASIFWSEAHQHLLIPTQKGGSLQIPSLSQYEKENQHPQEFSFLIFKCDGK